MQITMSDISSALPEMFLSISLMTMLLFGVFNKENSPKKLGWITIALLAISLLWILALITHEGVYFNNMYIIDNLSLYLKALIVISSSVSLILALEWLEIKKFTRFEFPIILLFSVLGMMLMVSANDLIILYISLELQSLAMYLLAGYKRRAVRSTEAGVKYFLYGSLASGVFLFGLSLVYGFSGTTNFSDIALYLSSAGNIHLGFLAGSVMVLMALLFKLGAVPFHAWLPDVYEGAPTPVSAFFASVPKIAIIGVLIRALYGIFVFSKIDITLVLSVIAVVSMTWGAVAAIYQKNIKRMMGYSAINHAGYMIMGLAVGGVDSLKAVLFYITIYAIMTLGVFACILLMRVGGNLTEEISDLRGLSKKHPYMAIGMSLLMLSMAGVPPMAGFFAKFYLFLAVIEKGYITLATIAVVTSAIAAFYYLRVVKLIYFDDPEERFDKVKPSVGGVMVVSTLLILVITIFPKPLLEITKIAVGSIFG
jgi:NADH-quinone oxidoreductase subunit N